MLWSEGSKKVIDTCPVCRSEDFKTIFNKQADRVIRSEDFKTIFNKQADRVIRSLHVFCTNKERGCKWYGEVNYITRHLVDCLHEVVCCPNDCRDSLQ